MVFRTGPILLTFVASVCIAAEPASLTPDQLAKAVKSDTLTIPTPGELFAALTKPGKPDWPGQYRGPIPTTYSNRAQIALNLGGLIADGFIAIEAQDSQQVKNIGTDIIKLAKALGVSENVLSRGKSINEFAENNEWDALQEELEATQNEVKSSMQSNRDQDFVILVSLGGWIRGTQVVSGSIMQNYNEGSAKVLRQPALVSYIQAKVKEMSPDLQKEPLVKAVSEQLSEIQKLVTFPNGTPTADEVRKLNEAVTRLMDEIQSKSDAK
jgi:HAMP domain-containing protein